MKKSIYVSGIVKDSKNNIEKYLFSENERLNAIIDELEERIDKAIKWIKEDYDGGYFECGENDIKELLKILGDKENEKE